MAQAIVDGANISLPSGSLLESYDELGSRYEVPVYCLYPPVNLVEEHSESSTNAEISDHLVPAIPSGGQNLPLLFRLSTGDDDVELTVSSQETIHSVKKRLYQLHPDTFPPPRQQRWFFGGRLLLDKMKIADTPQMQPHFVVQVIVSAPEDAQDTHNPANGNEIHLNHNAGKTIMVSSVGSDAAEDPTVGATADKPASRRDSNTSTSKRALTPIE